MSDATRDSLAASAAEVRDWLAANWDPELSLVEWRDRLADSGWGQPTWPAAFYGRGLGAREAAVVEQEFARIGAVGAATAGPRGLAAATLLEHGSDAQKKRYLRGILTGRDAWCQLFSEPGSGSDLAGATTRADRVQSQGEGQAGRAASQRWIVNGQKVWNTSAHHADYGILVARTDWEVPKHQGLSYFLIKMDQPGVEVRQLKQMNGHASFNEVFFTDAVVDHDDLVGELGQGWQIALTTLSYERSGFNRIRGGDRFEGRHGRVYREYERELEIANEPYTWYPQRAGRIDLLLERAAESGAIRDPAVRQDIATAIALQRCANWFSARGLARGPAGSIGKLAASRVARAGNQAHTVISGIEAMFEGDDSPLDGIVGEVLLSTPATSIAGGTDEIQKNIIAERILELPKEPRFDGGPFKDVPRN
ncbi:MAG: acyl-CoA dehydrogenase family protein [Pseudomonadales bacterium]